MPTTGEINYASTVLINDINVYAVFLSHTNTCNSLPTDFHVHILLNSNPSVVNHDVFDLPVFLGDDHTTQIGKVYIEGINKNIPQNTTPIYLGLGHDKIWGKIAFNMIKPNPINNFHMIGHSHSDIGLHFNITQLNDCTNLPCIPLGGHVIMNTNGGTILSESTEICSTKRPENYTSFNLPIYYLYDHNNKLGNIRLDNVIYDEYLHGHSFPYIVNQKQQFSVLIHSHPIISENDNIGLYDHGMTSINN
ncbi:MAG: hypothetical protein QW478_00740 [Candidatus Micrarchaeaceae archaeon]